MGKAYFLPEDDRDALKELLIAWKAGRINIPSRTPSIPSLGLSPDLYLALPLTGITALEDAGTGTAAGAGDVPGSGDCDIYQVVPTVTGTELISTGFSLTVYNNSRSSIGTDWVQIQRDKFGTWWAIPTAIASDQIILGTPTEYGTATTNSNQVAIANDFITCENTANGQIVTAFVRKGLVFLDGGHDYYLVSISGISSAEYEVLDPELEFMGYTNLDAVKGSTVNVQVWIGSPQTIWTDAGYDLEVQDNYGDIEAGSLVRCRWVEGRTWEIVNAECSVSGTGT